MRTRNSIRGFVCPSFRWSVGPSQSSCHTRVENEKNAYLGCCSWYCLCVSVRGVGGEVGVRLGVGCPCPPVRDDIVTPRHLFCDGKSDCRDEISGKNLRPSPHYICLSPPLMNKASRIPVFVCRCLLSQFEVFTGRSFLLNSPSQKSQYVCSRYNDFHNPGQPVHCTATYTCIG